jgi:hypothetical protein
MQALNADGTMGSGCAPATGPELPDGVWAVVITEGWGSSTITVDLACWYGPQSSQGKTAYQSCEDKADQECEGVDFFVWTSDSSRRLTVPVYAGAHFVRYDYVQAEWSKVLADPDFERLRGDILGNPDMPVWIYVNGGRVTQVYQEYGFCCLP